MLAVALLTTLAPHSHAQILVPPSQVPAPVYDVVSIKPDKSGSGGMSINGGGDSFKGMNLSIIMLLVNCYDVRSDLISGLPGWARSARFDIDAKILNPNKDQIDKLTDVQHQQLLLAIMKDRFHLQAHLETKILPVYDLVVAKSGPKFTGGPAANKDIAAAITQKHLTSDGMMLVNDGELTAAGVSVSSLAESLASAIGRTVIDKTGLTGTYNFELKWTPERGQPNADNGLPADQNSTSSIFTALEEQLGLKLVPSKGPVQTLVVDHVEMPSEN